MKRIWVIITLGILIITLAINASISLAKAEAVTYWIVRDFQSDIVVNSDSSLDITEKIVADCGECIGKHGIFRIVPTATKKNYAQYISTPITLKSITDFDGRPLKYDETVNNRDKTISWKIGDPDKTVQGINNYEIRYHVQNAVRDQKSFQELYWNLNGNFWDLDIEHFAATVHLPSTADGKIQEINLYSGEFGAKDVGLAKYQEVDNHTLKVESLGTLSPGEGITLSVTFPTGIFTLYQPGWIEQYGLYTVFLIPLLFLILCFWLWSKFGRDPKINPTVVPEFGPPADLHPMEMGMVYSDGGFDNRYISAAIIDLAVHGAIKIEKIASKGIFAAEDYRLNLLSAEPKKLSAAELLLIERLFGSKEKVDISELKNKFYTDIPDIQDKIEKFLVSAGLLKTRGRVLQILYIVIAIIFGGLFVLSLAFSYAVAFAFILCGVIFFVFSFLMRQRTSKEAELYRQILGFRLYMETAEKYRQHFNEKENIFERFLPYAVMFGLTGLWIQKMKEIYGEEYVNNYHPVWFVGSGLGTFNVDTLDSAVSSMSSQMASTLSSAPSSSGSGGGGFSGGGGGGGGGGGW